MQWMSNLKISTRLITAFMLMAAVIAVVGYIGLNNAAEIGKSSVKIYEVNLRPIALLVEVTEGFHRSRVYVRDAFLTNDPKDFDIIKEKMHAIALKSDKINQEYMTLFFNDEERKTFEEYKQNLMEYRKIRVEIVDLVKAGKREEALVLLKGTGAQIAQKVDEAIAKLVEIDSTAAKAANEQSQVQIANARVQMFGFIAAGFILAVGFGILMTRMISRPLQKMEESARSIANGDFSTLLASDAKDEIGMLTNSLGQVVQILNRFVSEQEKMANQHHNGGIISYRMPAEQFKGKYAEMVTGINDLVQAHIAVKMRVVDVISQYAIGNFAVDMDRLPGEKAKITQSIDDVKANLQALNAEVLMLAEAAQKGNLSVRGDASKFQYTFREIVSGLNKTLDAIVVPLTMAATTIEGISKGNIPARITDNYHGDFNAVKNNLNMFIDTLNAFVAAQEEMARQHHEFGMISYQIPTTQFSGKYAQMAEGMNDLVQAHIAVKMRVVDVISQYAIGNFTVDMDRLPGEKAKITQSIDDVKASLQALHSEITTLIRAAQQGNLKQRGDATKFQYTFREMVEGFNTTLDVMLEPMNEAVVVLQKMAEGNFATIMHGEYKGDSLTLKLALNETIQSVSQTLGQIMTVVHQVSIGAQQVATASNGLAQGAQNQAAALEQSSTAMLEISAQTKSNAVGAEQANLLAKESRHTAELGTVEMERLTTAMNAISDGSRSISKIIKVIDEIAFQTNLLALNAAVEAARAGRHGMGFAVVAEEVRNLAARSASAAKETAELIEGSIEKVQNGSVLVVKTAEILHQISENSVAVTQTIAEIATASKEQAFGVDQVNIGLNQISNGTQQGMANTETSAAAAEELSAQARELHALVNRFQLHTEYTKNSTNTTTHSAAPLQRVESQEYGARNGGGRRDSNGTATTNGASKGQGFEVNSPEFSRY